MLVSRPPIVVILGHVDHGKTTLLDYLRHSNIAAREAGGITQHIRSFQVPYQDSLITFIDTPGHQAFAAMRDRGSKIADIAVLVIAANDGVMPQTKQSLEFIKNANIPFIVALNKSDLPTSDPDRVKTQLTESGVIVEEFGGTVPTVSVSAKTGQGVSDLLEIINLLASLTPPQADPEGSLDAIVLESRLDPQKGPIAVFIIKNGTLVPGMPLFQDQSVGKVRALVDSLGQPLKTAPPSTPIEILGLTSVPEVGSAISNSPISHKNSAPRRQATNVPFDSLNLIVKADVAGSLEAILGSLPVRVNVISSGTGEVTETDVAQAATSNAQIAAFNTKVSSSVSKLAEVDKVSIHEFKIIYELLESVEKLLSPQFVEKVLGKATVLAEFKIDGDRIAGCKCVEGTISKAAQIKILRGDTIIGITRIKSLKTGKTETPSVKAGTEFGVLFSPYLDFKISDSIISFETHGSP